MDAVLVEDGNADGQSGLRSRRVYAMQDEASHRYVHARDLFAVRALCSSCVRDEQQVVIQQLLLSACSIARITSPVEGSACMGQACGWAGKGSQRPTRDIFLRWYKVAAERGGYPAPSMRSAKLPSMSLAIPVVGLDVAALAYSVANAQERCAASWPMLLAVPARAVIMRMQAQGSTACCEPFVWVQGGNAGLLPGHLGTGLYRCCQHGVLSLLSSSTLLAPLA